MYIFCLLLFSSTYVHCFALFLVLVSCKSYKFTFEVPVKHSKTETKTTFMHAWMDNYQNGNTSSISPWGVQTSNFTFVFLADVDVDKPDEKSIMTYVAQFLKHYPDPHQSETDGQQEEVRFSADAHVRAKNTLAACCCYLTQSLL